MVVDSRVRLRDGVEIPWLGFGTYKIEPGPFCEKVVSEALEVGYRHVDTAMYYRNEVDVGRALRASGIPRDELFLTTKLWNTDQGYESALKAFDASLRRLGTDYVDLYLIHWPVPGKFIESWRAMERLLDERRVRTIGVSNFMIDHLEELLSHATVLPTIDQVEFHPHLVNLQLLEYCKKVGIQMEAWSPLKQGAMPYDRAMASIGWRYGKSASQATLRWDLQHQVVSIPRTVRRVHMEENTDIFDFVLSEADMRTIDSLDRGERVGPDPHNVDF